VTVLLTAWVAWRWVDLRRYTNPVLAEAQRSADVDRVSLSP